MSRRLYNMCVLFILSALALRADAKPIGLLMGPIAPGSLAPLIVGVNSLDKDSVMDIYIDSGGGVVTESRHLMMAIDHALARGADVRCYVLGEAESAAFWILLHCKERYALPQSLLMFHHIRIQQPGNVTAQDAAKMLTELRQLDADYLADIHRLAPMVPLPHLAAWMDEEVEWTSAGIRAGIPGVLTGIVPVYSGLLEMLKRVHAPIQPPQKEETP